MGYDFHENVYIDVEFKDEDKDSITIPLEIRGWYYSEVGDYDDPEEAHKQQRERLETTDILYENGQWKIKNKLRIEYYKNFLLDLNFEDIKSIEKYSWCKEI